MEISVHNGKLLIPLSEMKKKYENRNKTETDKFGHVSFHFRCISISRHVTWYGSNNSLWSKC